MNGLTGVDEAKPLDPPRLQLAKMPPDQKCQIQSIAAIKE
jgi:hypothetical protein